MADEKAVNTQLDPVLDDFFDTYGYRIVLALRQITHAVDAYSRKLAASFDITGPQLLCLYYIANHCPATPSQISRHLSLSPSTVNGIVDRLKTKGLIIRKRPPQDRRKVLLTLAPKGRDVVQNAPQLLHRTLADEIRTLPELKQAAIALSLEEIVTLMNNESLKNR
ncbi:MAG: MarR family winged helix-turn-helix transcriptional regulator [Planctomycetota bacterium]|jgi:DNA-binding MarR family transcriptional regulator